MPRFPGVPHLRAVKAFEKAGFVFIRQGKHIILSEGVRTLQVATHNPVNAYTMGKLIRDAGLTVEQFKALI